MGEETKINAVLDSYQANKVAIINSSNQEPNNQIADILVDELGTIIMLDQNTLPRHSLGEDWGKGNYANAYVAMKNFQILPLDTSITNTENALNFQHFQKLDLSQTEIQSLQLFLI